MKAAKIKHTAFVTIIGHSPFKTPNASHNAKPTTVTAYIGVEMPPVSRVLMTFHGLRSETCHRAEGGEISNKGLCIHLFVFVADIENPKCRLERSRPTRCVRILACG